MSHCRLSAKMDTQKCHQLRRYSPECQGCTAEFTRSVLLDLPATVYEVVSADAIEHGSTLEESVIKILTLATSKDFLLVGRETARRMGINVNTSSSSG